MSFSEMKPENLNNLRKKCDEATHMFNIVDKNNNIIQSFDSVYEAWNVSRIMIAAGNDVVVEREDGTEVHYNDIYVDDDDFYEDYFKKVW